MASSFPQASSLKVPMEEKALDEQWNMLVDSHFVEIKRDIGAMVIIEDTVREDLLIELGWSMSREDLEDLLEGKPGSGTSFAPLVGSRRVSSVFHPVEMDESDRPTDSRYVAGRYAPEPSGPQAAAGKKDREARLKAEKKMGELAEQAEAFKGEVQVALKKAKEAQERAEEGQANAARNAREQSQSQSNALMMAMAMMGGGGGGAFGEGGGGAFPGMGGGHQGMGGAG